MQYLDDVTTFCSSEVIFLHFFFQNFQTFVFKKDPCITRCAQNEYFFPALYFYPKYVIRSSADTSS